MKNKLIALLLFVLMLTPLIVSFNYDKGVKVVPIFTGSVKRVEINSIIEKNVSFYVNEYSIKEKISYSISEAIITKALITNVPVNIAFALASEESEYNPKAINNKNKNGTYDFGLFQLNSRTFGNVKKKYGDVNKNANAAMLHLKGLFETYGSYDLALVSYNCGSPARYNSITRRHVKNILIKEEELDKWFNYKYRDTLSRSVN